MSFDLICNCFTNIFRICRRSEYTTNNEFDEIEYKKLNENTIN